jgi:hypothetical protein
LPGDATVRIGDENVGVVGRGKTDELLAFVFVIEDGNEMGLLFGGQVFAHAAQNHGADKRRGALEDGELIISDVSL